jgi:transcription antitermination protein NusB
MSRRRQGRELVLGCLYAYFSTGGSVEDVFSGQARRSSCDAATEDWAKLLFGYVIEHADTIDRTIREHAHKWDFGRIGQVEKNILRMSIAEIRYCLDTPPKVVINEALELARDFVDEDSRGFINGILDRVYKLELEKDPGDHSGSAPDSSESQRARSHRPPIRHD